MIASELIAILEKKPDAQVYVKDVSMVEAKELSILDVILEMVPDDDDLDEPMVPQFSIKVVD